MTPTTPDLSVFLHAIADPARRRILLALKERKPRPAGDAGFCAGDVEELVKLSQPTVSHHMRILQKAGLVEVKKQGHFRRYRRDKKRIAEMTLALKKHL